MSEIGEKTPRNTDQICVFYDGACPLCRAEISHYQKTDRDDRIAFVDVTRPEFETRPDLSRTEALARFHATRPDGRLVSGAEAFVEVWKVLPGWRWLARAAALPGLLWVMEQAYRGFLRCRPLMVRAFVALKGGKGAQAKDD
ncbi:MAG: DUF393 domain-containing protein [Paracoccaceae bacterium]